MQNLFIFNETITNGLYYSVINVISLVSVLCSVFVIISKNPIVSVLFLISLFLNIACYLMFLGMNFIGLSYLLVYVGAVSILFLFILMLINIRISELTSDGNNSIPLAVIIGVFFNIALYRLLPYSRIYPSPSYYYEKKISLVTNYSIGGSVTYVPSKYINMLDSNDLSFVTSQLWDGLLTESSHITSIGNIIYTNYPLWLILTSLILLLAMVGSIVITVKQ